MWFSMCKGSIHIRWDDVCNVHAAERIVICAQWKLRIRYNSRCIAIFECRRMYLRACVWNECLSLFVYKIITYDQYVFTLALALLQHILYRIKHLIFSVLFLLLFLFLVFFDVLVVLAKNIFVMFCPFCFYAVRTF